LIVSVVDDDARLISLIKTWIRDYTTSHPDQTHEEPQFFLDPESFWQYLNKLEKDKCCNTLIILDLKFDNNPDAGLNLLSRIKRSKHDYIKKIPVIIYSSSVDQSDIANCYKRYANSYVWKGNGAKRRERFNELLSFWFTVSTNPGQTPLHTQP